MNGTNNKNGTIWKNLLIPIIVGTFISLLTVGTIVWANQRALIPVVEKNTGKIELGQQERAETKKKVSNLEIKYDALSCQIEELKGQQKTNTEEILMEIRKINK